MAFWIDNYHKISCIRYTLRMSQRLSEENNWWTGARGGGEWLTARLASLSAVPWWQYMGSQSKCPKSRTWAKALSISLAVLALTLFLASSGSAAISFSYTSNALLAPSSLPVFTAFPLRKMSWLSRISHMHDNRNILGPEPRWKAFKSLPDPCLWSLQLLVQAQSQPLGWAEPAMSLLRLAACRFAIELRRRLGAVHTSFGLYDVDLFLHL